MAIKHKFVRLFDPSLPESVSENRCVFPSPSDMLRPASSDVDCAALPAARTSSRLRYQTLLPWFLSNFQAARMKGIEKTRILQLAECERRAAAVLRSMHELDIAAIDFRAAEQRRKLVDEQLEAAIAAAR